MLALEPLEHPDMQLEVPCEERLDSSETETGVPWVNSAVDCLFFVEDVSVETERELPWVNSAVVLVGNKFLQCSKKLKQNRTSEMRVTIF